MTTPRGSTARRTGQLLTGFGSLVVLVALLAGAPVALLAFAGNPLPDHLPTLTEIGTLLTSRDDGQLFIRALALVGWFGWATFAFSVLVELGAQVTRRQTPRLPGMGRQQRAAAALLGSIALIIAASPAASAAATLTQPLPAAAGTGVATTLDTSRAGLGTAPSAGLGGAALGAVPGSGLGPIPGAGPAHGAEKPVYRVARGDYLGEVAERYLDDFERYPEVARLNHLHDADRIRPGQLIKLPAEADDTGARRHASGHLVPGKPRKPSPRPPATAPGSPGSPGSQAGPQQPDAPGTHTTPGRPTGPVTPATPKPTRKLGPATPQTATPQTAQPPAERPVGVPPAMAAGASRATPEDTINRPLAVSAVLAVASIVGAQIGAVLGLRRRPVRVAAGRTSAARIVAARTATDRTPGRSIGSRASAARDLVTGRHRRD
ncbi:LysM peptidoglycan-binding domain-containing protein [Micromonospora sp. WMMD714]|uniref:LysM peptidoglycan-binding domain-containing protein n=1 Tax=Micromonospora sp. WMMD714 TaxID=3016097 RepID=UPI00249C11FF|nr:LysM peptidoglycan-binding domain-containing protein [Micromonospora sp. WMMD714]WFE63341.1 LysM peptidoglycan-binding domain-containing protein [Micromonospora sp. WMMD714]